MIDENESDLICDLAEFYHIYDYRSHSPQLIATLLTGLRDESRIMQKICGVKASQINLLLAHIADKLSILINGMSSKPIDFPSMVEAINGEDKQKALMSFDSDEDFRAYWERVNNGG